MKLFLDTNILIDLLGDRKPFSKWAFEIFNNCKTDKWNLFTSSNSILTTYYILDKNLDRKIALRGIKTLLNWIDIISITKNDLETALIADFHDFEDAIQHNCAIKLGEVDYIISRNKKDFKNSKIQVLTSEEIILTYTD